MTRYFSVLFIVISFSVFFSHAVNAGGGCNYELFYIYRTNNNNYSSVIKLVDKKLDLSIYAGDTIHLKIIGKRFGNCPANGTFDVLEVNDYISPKFSILQSTISSHQPGIFRFILKFNLDTIQLNVGNTISKPLSCSKTITLWKNKTEILRRLNLSEMSVFNFPGKIIIDSFLINPIDTLSLVFETLGEGCKDSVKENRLNWNDYKKPKSYNTNIESIKMFGLGQFSLSVSDQGNNYTYDFDIQQCPILLLDSLSALNKIAFSPKLINYSPSNPVTFNCEQFGIFSLIQANKYCESFFKEKISGIVWSYRTLNSNWNVISRDRTSININESGQYLVSFEYDSIAYERYFIVSILSDLTNNEDPIESNITIGPNPFKEKLNGFFNGNYKSAEFAIYNSLGEVVKTGALTSQEFSIDLQNFSSGSYFIRIFNEYQSSTKLLMKR